MYFFGYLYEITALFEPYNLSIIAGAAAYVVFMSQFILSSRLRFLERRVPQDRLLALHGSAGMASFALVLIHGILKYILLIRFESPNLQSLLGVFALLTSAVLTPLAFLILRGRGKRKGHSPPYEKVRISHNLFALAGLAVVVHVFMASSTWSIALKTFTLLWGVLCLGSYVWHKLIRPRQTIDLVLADKVEVAPGIHRYTFDGVFPRKSGQFAYASFDSALTGREAHPFTLSSPSDEAPEITVRADGDFTRSLSRIAVGTALHLDGPYGKFRPTRLPIGTPVVFLVGGIGMTPALSLARDENLRSLYPMTLLWSMQTPSEASLAEPLENLAEASGVDLRIIYTREAPVGKVYGRLDRDALAPLVESKPEAGWFLCGPAGFSASMRTNLKKLGVRRKHIIEERFSW